jgi:plastocyanin
VKKLLIIITICSFFALLLAACGADRSGDAASGGSTPANQVQMNDTQFVQSSITIHKGESITLVATTFTPHIIANGTWDNGQAKAAKESGAPEVKNVQINGNSSGSIGPFTTAGTFKLYCTIHSGMNLTVIVQ